VHVVMHGILMILPVSIEIGLTAACLSQFISRRLLGLSPFDPVSYLLTALILSATAIQLRIYPPAGHPKSIR